MKKIVLFIQMILILFVALNVGGWLPAPVKINTEELSSLYGARDPKICSSGTNVYILWDENRNGLRGIFFNYSNDSGLTWQDNDIRIDHRPDKLIDEPRTVEIACFGENVYAVWNDDRNLRRDIYFNYSHDGGKTWNDTDIRLDTGDLPGANYSWYPEIACFRNNVYVVWHDYRNGAADIYFNTSADNGKNWQKWPIRLDVGDSAGSADSISPKIAISNDNVYVVWNDGRNGVLKEDVYFNRSLDGGANWLADDMRLNAGDQPGLNRTLFPNICCWGRNVYVVWNDDRKGRDDIYFNRSTDQGSTWLAQEMRIDNGDLSFGNSFFPPQIACAGNRVYVVWTDRRLSLNRTQIYFNSSHDAGSNWQQLDRRLNTGPTQDGIDVGVPALVCKGNNVFVAWSDRRDGAADIYYSQSNNGGFTWMTHDHRIDTGDPRGMSSSISPQVAHSDGRLHVVWQDSREGTPNIYFNTKIDSGHRLVILDAEGGTTSPKAGHHVYEDGEEVTIKAKPDQGYAFTRWSGDIHSTENPLTIVMDSSKKIWPHFVGQFRLRIAAGKGGTTKPEPGRHFYDVGDRARVIAIPEKGYRFKFWRGDLTKTKNPVSVKMNTNKRIRAFFVKQCKLTVGALPGGTTQPSGISIYDRGTRVKITAIPDANFKFVKWSGDIDALRNPLEFTLWSDKNVVAVFRRTNAQDN